MDIFYFSFLDVLAKALAMIIVFKGRRRRLPMIIVLLIAGTAFLVSLAFERGVYPSDWPIVVCAMAGSASMALCFAILWVYTAELYPTSVRYVIIAYFSDVA